MNEKRPTRFQARLAARARAEYAWLTTLDRAKLAALFRTHRRVSYGLAVAMLVAIVGTAGFVVSILRAVPDPAALRGIGTMAQATTLLDANNQHAFTIFREQRVEVPLSRVSKRLVDAILAIKEQGFSRRAATPSRSTWHDRASSPPTRLCAARSPRSSWPRVSSVSSRRTR